MGGHQALGQRTADYLEQFKLELMIKLLKTQEIVGAATTIHKDMNISFTAYMDNILAMI